MDIATQGTNDTKKMAFFGSMILAMAIVIHGFNSSGSTASLDLQGSAVQQLEPELNKVQLKSPVLKIQVPEEVSTRVQYEVKLGDTQWTIAQSVKPDNVLIKDYVNVLSTVNKGNVLKPGSTVHIPNEEDLKGVSLPTVDIHFDINDENLINRIIEAEGSSEYQSKNKRKLLNGSNGYSFKGGRFYPYVDSRGNYTIGYGHYIGKSKKEAQQFTHGISKKEALKLLKKDMKISYDNFILLLKTKKATVLNEEMQIVLFEMSFIMGSEKLSKFKKMWKHLRNEDYYLAKEEMINSRWYKQVGNRSDLMLSGI